MKVEVAVLGPNSPYSLCGRKATLNSNWELRSCVKVEMAVLGSLSLTVRNYGLCGRKATLNSSSALCKVLRLMRPQDRLLAVL